MSGAVGGKVDREWKNHKYTTRKRNKKGKWIYDISSDNKSSDQKYKIIPQTQKDINDAKNILLMDKVEELISDLGAILIPGSYGVGYEDRRRQKDEAFDELVKDGENFINILMK